MRGIRFVAALALIYSNTLFAAEPSGNAAPSGAEAISLHNREPYVGKYHIEPPDVIEIKMVKPAPIQPGDSRTRLISGQYRVGPDGTVNLRQYGVVKITGMTATEARSVIQDRLKQYLDSPELSVEVVAYNSKSYYVVIQKAGEEDRVRRMPLTGNERVLDAIAEISPSDDSERTIWLAGLSNKKMWIARRDPQNVGSQKILSFDWEAIAKGAETAMNYELLSGDRLYIADKEQRRGFSTAARNYNRARNGL
jgi:protein involved in polysaccharide export with SLBB domain